MLAGGVGGTLPLEIGGRRVPVRVAAIVDHFPGTSGEAVIGDITSLETAVNTQVPGAGETNEIWLDVPPGGTATAMAALARPPFRGVEAVSRAALLAEARDDPLGHGTLLALDSAAVVALLLAALGLALTVLSDLRDDRGDLYDLESQGAEPTPAAAHRPRPSARRRDRRSDRRLGGRRAPRAARDPGRLGDGARRRPPTCRCGLRSTFACSRSPHVAYLLLAAALVALATRRAFRDDRGPARAQEAAT